MSGFTARNTIDLVSLRRNYIQDTGAGHCIKWPSSSVRKHRSDNRPLQNNSRPTSPENPCLSGADSQNSKIATTAVARLLSPMPCSLALKGLHQGQHEWLLSNAVTRKVGQTSPPATAGSKRAPACVCFVSEHGGKPWQAAAAAAGRAPHRADLQVTHTLCSPSSHPNKSRKRQSSRKKQNTTTTPTYTPPHYRKNGQGWYVCFASISSRAHWMTWTLACMG